MLNATQKENIDKICIIGGSGRIGNKVMSILMQKEIKVSILLSRHTVDELNKTNGNEYRKSLNDKISKYNETKQESEKRCLISEDTLVYFDIKMAHQDENRIFIFCGKDSDEVRYFLNKLQETRQENRDLPKDPITFLSIADRLANDGSDLNSEFKDNKFTDVGIFYHHADIITEAGERASSEVKKFLVDYPIKDYKYELYDFFPSEAYGKAYNTTRKMCRLLGCEADNHELFLTKTDMHSYSSSIKISENLSVNTARFVDGSLNVLEEHEWLRSTENSELPSIGIKIYDNEVEIQRSIFFFKDREIGLIEDMARYTCDKVEKKRTKDTKKISPPLI
jgi:hypothetical protein